MGKRILLTYTNFSTFVKTDYEILGEKYDVVKYQYKPVKGIYKNAVEFIKQFLYLLLHIWKFDSVYIWFADYHSFLPVLYAKILRKKSFVIIGGYDMANLPEIHYGSLSRPLRKRLTLFSCRYATLCLPVVEGLEKKLQEICPRAKSKTIYTGYQFKLDRPIDVNTPREKIILTVSITENYQRYMVKGLDRFKELAQHLPDYKFHIIGVKENAKKLFEPIPSNLYLFPPVQQEELIEFYLKSSFYAQFSRSEGLPNALCEAMLYGCLPLGTNIGGISTAIENYGMVINDWDLKIITDFVSMAIETDRKNISQSIINRFDIKYRKDKLLKMIS